MSISSSLFGQKIKAAAEADKAAAEAAAIAKEKNDELDRYIARHAQDRGVARSAAGTNADSGVSMDSTAVQRINNYNDDQADDAFDNFLAKIQDPSDDVFNKTIVDNSSPNNETVKIGEIFARPNIDDQSMSSVSVNMDISNHKQGANTTGTELLQDSISSDGRHHPVRSTCTGNAFLHHHVPFPIILHTLLKDNPCPSAIQWNAKGTKIVLHSKHKDFDHVLRSYFGDKTKFSNFRRKANRWLFQTKCIDKESSKYHMWNKQFLRGEDLACFCPAEAKKAGHKTAETPHHMPSPSTTTAANKKPSSSASTKGTLPTLVTTSTNDATSSSISNDVTMEAHPHGDSMLTSAMNNKKRKAQESLPKCRSSFKNKGRLAPI